MSISPVMSPMVYSYAPSGSSKKQTDSEYEKILIMMEMLGIESTGDKTLDKVLLKNAVTQKLQQEASSSASGADYIPFLDIMDSLDLDSTGNVDDDYDRTIDELDYRISMANDDEEKQYYTELRDEVETLYTENSYDNARTSLFMGSSQVADLNRYMLGI